MMHAGIPAHFCIALFAGYLLLFLTVMHIALGRWTEQELTNLMREASCMSDPGLRVAGISGQFLGTAYQESTLRGGVHTAEDLVINLCGVDCFTFLDYVEAMRRSSSFEEFIDALKQVRYKSGEVSFMTRNHFFTDWIAHNAACVEDVTVQIGSGRIDRTRKTLNRREDGSCFIAGIKPLVRTITYVPEKALDDSVMLEMRIGDYAGIYSDTPGLDVSHVGIIIKGDAGISLRHASSVSDLRRVVDQDLRSYMAGKAGLIVMRPV